MESLGVSLAAQAATLPIIVASFGRLSLIAPVVNLAVVPLVPLAMAAGVVALAGGALVLAGAPACDRHGGRSPRVARADRDRPDRPPCRGRPSRRSTSRRESRGWRVCSRRSGSPASCSIAVAVGRSHGRSRYGAMRRRAPAVGRPLVLVVVALGTVTTLALGGIAVVDRVGRGSILTVLDVGQGDAVLLESRSGSRLLVDGGPDPDRLLVRARRADPAWDRRIDLVVLSHPHEDHVAGLRDAPGALRRRTRA